MELNVVDTNDPWLVKPTIQLHEWGKAVIEIPAGANGVERMVTEIISRAGCPGVISVLRIYAHGNSGVIKVAGGDVDAEDQLSAISLGNLSRLAGILQRLAPYFAPRARVELQGCYVARGSAGEKLLVKLAQALHVRVQASARELPVAAVQFPGGVIEANPHGGLICVPRTEMTRENSVRR